MHDSTPITVIRLHLYRFKMFADVAMDFVPGVNLVKGRNASGKTTVFQAIDVFKHLALGNIGNFYQNTNQFAHSLQFKDQPQLKMELFLRAGDQVYAWLVHWDVGGGFLVKERVCWGSSLNALRPLWIYEDGQIQPIEPGLVMENKGTGFIFQNSMHCHYQFRETHGLAWRACLLVKRWARGMNRLDILDPSLLAGPSHKERTPAFGTRGHQFAAFLAGLSPRERREVNERMRGYDSDWERFYLMGQPGNQVSLKYREAIPGTPKRAFALAGAGQRRLLALATIPCFPPHTTMVVIEEFESGIDAGLLPYILQDLKRAPFQIVATTYIGDIDLSDCHVLNFAKEAGQVYPRVSLPEASRREGHLKTEVGCGG